MSRGFGSTFGAGTTDAIKTAVSSVAFATQHSLSCWVYVNAAGGSSLGRLMSRNATAGNETLCMNSSATSMKYAAKFTTTAGGWTWTSSATGGWHHVLLAYDGSSTSNKPTVYIDGASVSVSTSTSPSGTFSPSSSAL